MLKFASGTFSTFICIILSCFLLNPAVLRAAEPPVQPDCEARLVVPGLIFLLESGYRNNVITLNVLTAFVERKEWKNPFKGAEAGLLRDRYLEKFDELSADLTESQRGQVKAAVKLSLAKIQGDQEIERVSMAARRLVINPKELPSYGLVGNLVSFEFQEGTVDGRPVLAAQFADAKLSGSIVATILDPFAPPGLPQTFWAPMVEPREISPGIYAGSGSIPRQVVREGRKYDFTEKKPAAQKFKALGPRTLQFLDSSGNQISRFTVPRGHDLPAEAEVQFFNYKGKTYATVVAVTQKSGEFGSQDYSVSIVDVADGKPVNRLGIEVSSGVHIAFRNGEPYLTYDFYFRQKFYFRFLKAFAKSELEPVESGRNENPIERFTHDGREYLVWGESNQLVIYDVETDSYISCPTMFDGYPSVLKVMRHEGRIVIVAYDGKFRTFDIMSASRGPSSVVQPLSPRQWIRRSDFPFINYEGKRIVDREEVLITEYGGNVFAFVGDDLGIHIQLTAPSRPAERN